MQCLMVSGITHPRRDRSLSPQRCDPVTPGKFTDRFDYGEVTGIEDDGAGGVP